MEPSLSDFVAFGVLREEEGDPEFAHDTFIFRHADHDENYRDLMSGRPSTLMVNIPTIVDPTLAPEGEHIVNLTVPIAYDIGEPWPRQSSACRTRRSHCSRSGCPSYGDAFGSWRAPRP
jgi:prolycopene isomerase